MSKKVLLLGYADGIGGAQTAFRRMYNFLKEGGYNVKVIMLIDYNPNEQIIKKDIISKINYKGQGVKFNIKKIIALLNASYKASMFSPDLFISIGLSNSSNFIANRLKDICYKVGQDFIATRNSEDSLWKASSSAFNSLAVQSPSMVDNWEKVGWDISKLTWLPCFPEQPFKGITQNLKYKKGAKIKLAYFGRLASNKGIELLIKAISNLCLEEITLDIWGKGPELEKLIQLTQEVKLEESIKFLGAYPSNIEGAKLMASYNALVLTSTEKEGLPLILLEAMAYGIPFLATDVGAIKDCCLLNKDAILVKPNISDISCGLNSLIKGIKNNEFNANRQQKFYNDNFSYEVMAKRWEKFIHNPYQFIHES